MVGAQTEHVAGVLVQHPACLLERLPLAALHDFNQGPPYYISYGLPEIRRWFQLPGNLRFNYLGSKLSSKTGGVFHFQHVLT